MRIAHVATIAASPERLFELTTDIEAWPALMPTVTSVERLDHGPLAVGSRARLEQPGQRPTVWTVERIDAPTAFVWSARTMGVRMTASHHIDAAADGTSSNTLAIDLEGFGAGLLGRLVGGRIRRVLATENDCFRRAAETAPAT
jgi:ribosome-associated toxin RatA of RatAB toxin-antitoxin module